MTIEGRTLHYAAAAGTLVLRDYEGKAKAEVFYVAYEKRDAGHGGPEGRAAATQAGEAAEPSSARPIPPADYLRL